MDRLEKDSRNYSRGNEKKREISERMEERSDNPNSQKVGYKCGE